MKINGYDVTIDRLTNEPAKGQWRAALNGKTIAVSRSRKAVMASADFLATRLTPEAFRALTSPIETRD